MGQSKTTNGHVYNSTYSGCVCTYPVSLFLGGGGGGRKLSEDVLCACSTYSISVRTRALDQDRGFESSERTERKQNATYFLPSLARHISKTPEDIHTFLKIYASPEAGQKIATPLLWMPRAHHISFFFSRKIEDAFLSVRKQNTFLSFPVSLKKCWTALNKRITQRELRWGGRDLLLFFISRDPKETRTDFVQWPAALTKIKA